MEVVGPPVPHGETGGARSAQSPPNLVWDWVLDPVTVEVPVGIAGVDDEPVSCRLFGRGVAAPKKLEFEVRSVTPYVVERLRLLQDSSGW